MKKKNKIRVGISVGDISGIGIEIILKCFEDSRMLDFCTPVIFGSTKVVSAHKRILNLSTNIHGIDQLTKMVHNKVNLLNVWKEAVDVTLGNPESDSGAYAFKSLESAVKALSDKEIDILLTAPIDKHNIQSDKFDFQGHTEYLEDKLEGESLMILMSEDLKVGLVTGHVPISEVTEMINPGIDLKKNRNHVQFFGTGF